MLDGKGIGHQSALGGQGVIDVGSRGVADDFVVVVVLHHHQNDMIRSWHGQQPPWLQFFKSKKAVLLRADRPGSHESLLSCHWPGPMAAGSAGQKSQSSLGDLRKLLRSEERRVG